MKRSVEYHKHKLKLKIFLKVQNFIWIAYYFIKSRSMWSGSLFQHQSIMHFPGMWKCKFLWSRWENKKDESSYSGNGYKFRDTFLCSTGYEKDFFVLVSLMIIKRRRFQIKLIIFPDVEKYQWKSVFILSFVSGKEMKSCLFNYEIGRLTFKVVEMLNLLRHSRCGKQKVKISISSWNYVRHVKIRNRCWVIVTIWCH